MKRPELHNGTILQPMFTKLDQNYCCVLLPIPHPRTYLICIGCDKCCWFKHQLMFLTFRCVIHQHIIHGNVSTIGQMNIKTTERMESIPQSHLNTSYNILHQGAAMRTYDIHNALELVLIHVYFYRMAIKYFWLDYGYHGLSPCSLFTVYEKTDVTASLV